VTLDPVRVALGTLATFLENGNGSPRKGNVGGICRAWRRAPTGVQGGLPPGGFL